MLITGFDCEGEGQGEEERVIPYQVRQLSLAADITTVSLNTEKSLIRRRGTTMKGPGGHEGDGYACQNGEDGSWLEERVPDPDFGLKIRMVPNIITPFSIRQ